MSSIRFARWIKADSSNGWAESMNKRNPRFLLFWPRYSHVENPGDLGSCVEDDFTGTDGEYKRLGTVWLLAGLDLHTGLVTEIVSDRHASADFIALLGKLDAGYPAQAKIRVLLDNHSAHISKETQAYLGLHPQRFEFVFTPKHGSWLNIVETLFSKMARTMLRGIRVASKQELN